MQARMSQLMKSEGVGPGQAIKAMFIQMIPMALFFITLNRMASPEMGYEALKTGGMLWFTDLSLADPYYIFPTFAIVTMAITLFLNPSPRPPSATMKVVFSILGLFSFYITAGFPTAVHMYWAAVNIMTILTMSILRIPDVRKKLGIPLPLADSVKSEHNQLFDRPPSPPAAAAAVQQAAAPRPASKRQQRLQQQAEQKKQS
jgi:YidC/Oxa1 family membrane protein insertase